MNAMSEFVTPTNFSDDGVFETSRRFQAASPASWRPALSPTRGSGVGADTHPTAGPPDGETPPPEVVGVEDVAHAAARTARAGRELRTDVIADSSLGVGLRSFSACVRSRSTGRRRRRRRDGTRLVLGGTLRAEELVHHGERALVVSDHECKKQPVELGAARLVQLLEV